MNDAPFEEPIYGSYKSGYVRVRCSLSLMSFLRITCQAVAESTRCIAKLHIGGNEAIADQNVFRASTTVAPLSAVKMFIHYVVPSLTTITMLIPYCAALPDSPASASTFFSHAATALGPCK